MQREIKGFKAAIANVSLPPSAKRQSKRGMTKGARQGPPLKSSKGGKLKRRG
jgi:hypothetical protein